MFSLLLAVALVAAPVLSQEGCVDTVKEMKGCIVDVMGGKEAMEEKAAKLVDKMLKAKENKAELRAAAEECLKDCEQEEVEEMLDECEEALDKFPDSREQISCRMDAFRETVSPKMETCTGMEIKPRFFMVMGMLKKMKKMMKSVMKACGFKMGSVMPCMMEAKQRILEIEGPPMNPQEMMAKGMQLKACVSDEAKSCLKGAKKMMCECAKNEVMDADDVKEAFGKCPGSGNFLGKMYKKHCAKSESTSTGNSKSTSLSAGSDSIESDEEGDI